MSDDEIVRCLQCDWPVLRCEPITQIAVPGDVLGPPKNEWEAMGLVVLGVVHLQVCAYDYVTKEPRARTQKRRAGKARMN